MGDELLPPQNGGVDGLRGSVVKLGWGTDRFVVVCSLTEMTFIDLFKI